MLDSAFFNKKKKRFQINITTNTTRVNNANEIEMKDISPCLAQGHKMNIYKNRIYNKGW